MLFFILSIVCSLAIGLIFKWFQREGIDTFQAIVVNYFVCVLTGGLFSGDWPWPSALASEPWLPVALGLGFLFVTGFYAVGMTVQLYGLTIASVMQKMSLILSVPFAIWVFAEPFSWGKGIGLALALTAVVLINWPKKAAKLEPEAPENQVPKLSPWWLLVPIYAFFDSGAIECLLGYAQAYLVKTESQALFSTTLFGSAGVLGASFALLLALRGRLKPSWKNLKGGIVLGVPNYFSIFFLIRAFDWADKSMVLPLANLSVVGGAALLGFGLFREPLSKLNYFGLFAALTAILLIAFA